MSKTSVQPRFIRAFQAPAYLGMCREVFNKTVRPYVREFPIGQRGIGFDRSELDQWAETYVATHSIPKNAKTAPVKLPMSTSTHAQKTSEDFHKVVAEILGEPEKGDRR